MKWNTEASCLGSIGVSKACSLYAEQRGEGRRTKCPSHVEAAHTQKEYTQYSGGMTHRHSKLSLRKPSSKHHGHAYCVQSMCLSVMSACWLPYLAQPPRTTESLERPWWVVGVKEGGGLR